MDQSVPSSDKYRQHQVQYIAQVARHFGWREDPFEEACYPPAAWQQHYHDVWYSPCEESRGVPLRDYIEQYIFADRIGLMDKRSYVKHHDPAVMRLVDQMVEDYGLCLYWEEYAKALRDQDKAQGGQHNIGSIRTYAGRLDAVNTVQSLIASHASQQLHEQGYSDADTIKIVGAAIKGFALLGKSDSKHCGVEPAKQDFHTPTTLIQDIHRYARAQMAISEDKYLPPM